MIVDEETDELVVLLDELRGGLLLGMPQAGNQAAARKFTDAPKPASSKRLAQSSLYSRPRFSLANRSKNSDSHSSYHLASSG